MKYGKLTPGHTLIVWGLSVSSSFITYHLHSLALLRKHFLFNKPNDLHGNQKYAEYATSINESCEL